MPIRPEPIKPIGYQRVPQRFTDFGAGTSSPAEQKHSNRRISAGGDTVATQLDERPLNWKS